MSKSNKLPSRKKVDLGLLQHGLGHRSARALMAGDTENVCHDIELRIYQTLFAHYFRYLL